MNLPFTTHRLSVSSVPLWFIIPAIIAAAVLVYRQRFESYHLAVVDAGKLYRDGNRGLREYKNMLRRVQPKTVVTLIDDAELADATKPEFAAEANLLARRSDVALERVAIDLGGWPDDAALAQFFAVATDPARQPVVVHCAHGVRRTGMMVAAYQMSVLGWSKQKTAEQMLAFGHSMRTVGDVQRFIEVYDPVTRRMTEPLAKSVE